MPPPYSYRTWRAFSKLIRSIRDDRDALEPITPTAPRNVARVRRNDPCPCGSGRKLKQCHGKAIRTTPSESEQPASQ